MLNQLETNQSHHMKVSFFPMTKPNKFTKNILSKPVLPHPNWNNHTLMSKNKTNLFSYNSTRTKPLD